MRNDAPIVLAEWAARVNAETRAFMGVSVAPEIPERQEARAYPAGLSDQETAACVAADLARVRALGGRPRDEYEGLSLSFAALCRAADEKQRSKPVDPAIERLGRLLADDVSLERAWAEVSRPAGVARSTLKAAEYLIRAGDAEPLQHWLAKHSTDERSAIQKHFGRQKHAAKPRTD